MYLDQPALRTVTGVGTEIPQGLTNIADILGGRALLIRLSLLDSSNRNMAEDRAKAAFKELAKPGRSLHPPGVRIHSGVLRSQTEPTDELGAEDSPVSGGFKTAIPLAQSSYTVSVRRIASFILHSSHRIPKTSFWFWPERLQDRAEQGRASR